MFWFSLLLEHCRLTQGRDLIGAALLRPSAGCWSARSLASVRRRHLGPGPQRLVCQSRVCLQRREMRLMNSLMRGHHHLCDPHRNQYHTHTPSCANDFCHCLLEVDSHLVLFKNYLFLFICLIMRQAHSSFLPLHTGCNKNLCFKLLNVNREVVWCVCGEKCP